MKAVLIALKAVTAGLIVASALNITGCSAIQSVEQKPAADRSAQEAQEAAAIRNRETAVNQNGQGYPTTCHFRCDDSPSGPRTL